MNLEIRETYINRTENVQFGDSDWMPAYCGTRGGIFRDARAEYGGCTGKMYRDVRVKLSDAATAFGVTIPAQYRWDVVHVGWVFAKRMRYEDARPDCYTGKFREQDYYTREVWVEVREQEPEPECEVTSAWRAASLAA